MTVLEIALSAAGCLLAALLLLILWSACVVSGRISNLERQHEKETAHSRE